MRIIPIPPPPPPLPLPPAPLIRIRLKTILELLRLFFNLPFSPLPSLISMSF